MKSKLLIVVCAVVAVLLVLAIIQDVQYSNLMKPVEIENISISTQTNKIQHFFESLSDYEKEIYYDTINLLDQYKCGEILLKEPITPRSYFRIETALRYDSERYWYLAYLFPFNENFEYVNIYVEQENPENLIHKLLLVIESEAFMQDYKDMVANDNSSGEAEQVSEDINPYKQYQDRITAVEHYNDVNIDSSFYSKKHENVERKLNEIISAIPDGSNQEDTVQYFCKWLVENMVYDPIMANQILSGSFSVYDGLVESGNITSILKGEGVCAGFDMILTTLCNRVGIESYITIGITPDGRHTWSAIKIGNEVYYKDTTYEIVKKEIRPLMTRAQFYAKNKSYKPFSDIFENLWAK